MARLTTTSYGVLSLLAKRPMSAYDLTKEIRRSLTACWPRAATGLYQEPKNLVAHGLARARVEVKGRQSRTVYSITPAGRRALRTWFTQPTAPLVLESEAVVRCVFAEHGTRADQLATLAELERQIEEVRSYHLTEMPGYIERMDASVEHLADLALVGKLYLDLYAAIAAWTRWARQQIELRPDEWPDGALAGAMAAVRSMLGAATSPPNGADSPA